MSATTQNPRMCVSETASLLRAAYPEHGAKLAARAADVSPRTAEAWVTGRREPSASILLRMAARCDRMAAALERLLDDRRRARASRQMASPAGGDAAAPADTGTR